MGGVVDRIPCLGFSTWGKVVHLLHRDTELGGLRLRFQIIARRREGFLARQACDPPKEKLKAPISSRGCLLWYWW